MIQIDLVEVAHFGLEENDHTNVGFVEGLAVDDEQAFANGLLVPGWDGAPPLFVVVLLVDQKALASNDDTTWAFLIFACRHWDERMSRLGQLLSELSNHVVEAEINFVDNQSLLHVSSDNSGGLRLGLAVVDLDAGELRVLEPVVQSAHIEGHRVWLMRLERTRNYQLVVRVSVHLVDELLPLDGAYEDHPALRVSCQVLARYDPAAAGLPVGLLVDLNEPLLGHIELEDDDPSRVRACNQEIFLHSNESERHDGSDQPEHLLSVDDLELAVTFINLHQLQNFSLSHTDLDGTWNRETS